jgi:hypothetical protein
VGAEIRDLSSLDLLMLPLVEAFDLVFLLFVGLTEGCFLPVTFLYIVLASLSSANTNPIIHSSPAKEWKNGRSM